MRKLIVAGLAAALAVTVAASALAAQPKNGVTVYGKTSYTAHGPTSIYLKVNASGTKIAYVQFPAVDSISPPRATMNLKISATGKFSGTWEGTGSTSGSGSHADWTLKVAGRFITSTKARGTFSATGSVTRGKGAGAVGTTIRTGGQTFNANKHLP